MNLLQEAYQRLFPEENFTYQSRVEYNRRLADFNANIRLQRNTISLHLNLQWKDIDDEIKVGLAQTLLLKLLKRRKHTPQIDLYTNFVKNIPLLTPKTKFDEVLEGAFLRVNERYFQGVIEQPNLQWGQDSFRKLAHYNFHNDTVTVSTLFQKARREILDYLMYHELLHKYHQFSHRNGRSSFHTREFRKAEERYPKQKEIEREIGNIASRRKSWKWW